MSESDDWKIGVISQTLRLRVSEREVKKLCLCFVTSFCGTHDERRRRRAKRIIRSSVHQSIVCFSIYLSVRSLDLYNSPEFWNIFVPKIFYLNFWWINQWVVEKVGIFLRPTFRFHWSGISWKMDKCLYRSDIWLFAAIFTPSTILIKVYNKFLSNKTSVL